MFTKAQTQIDSALAGILNSLTPVFTLMVGFVMYRIAFLKKQVIGVFIGLMGAFGLIVLEQNLTDIQVNFYAMYVVLATIFYGISINEIKAHLTHLNGIQITSLSFLFIGPVALIYLLTTDLASTTSNPGWPYHLAALAVLAVVGTAFAMLLMNSLIRYASPVFASSVTYVIPVFAIFWGLADEENITLFHLLCMGLILSGVYLTNRQKREAR